MSAIDQTCYPDEQKFKPVRLPTVRLGLLILLLGLLGADMGNSLYRAKPLFSSFFTLVTRSYANSIGLIETRKGHLSNHPELVQTVTDGLKPFDILLIAAPFKATAMTTPGHYTHVAIWLGDGTDWHQRQWDENPRYKKLLNAVRDGRSVVQSDRFGVRMGSLDELLNADEIIIYRSDDLQKTDFYFDRIVENMGKAYDYNLDGLNQQQLICTELVSSIFPDLPVDMTRWLGRSFIVPDQIKQGLEQASNWHSWFYADAQTEESARLDE